MKSKWGRSFKVIDEFRKYLDNADFYNGGNYNELNKILEMTINYDTVFWWANVANGLPKIRNVKEINYSRNVCVFSLKAKVKNSTIKPSVFFLT